MPIQMVCDSTSSLVGAAIREALHSTGSTKGRLSVTSGMSHSVVSGSTNGTINTGAGPSCNGLSTQNNKLLRRSMCDNDNENNDDAENGTNDLVASISQSLRHGQQVKPISYEEGPSYSASLEKLKSKYIVLRATTSDVSSESQNDSNATINGSGSGSGSGGPLMHVSKNSTNASNSAGSSTQALMNGKSSSATQQSNKVTSSTNLQNGVSSARNSPAPASGKETATLPTPKRTLFPRENVQIGWKTTGRKWHVGAGMINMGNTCYLNSTLQALFHVPAIANWLLADVQHRDRCDDGGSGGSCIICAMAKTLAESQSNQSAIRPYLVYSKLRLVCKHLVPGRQEDAHEFLRYLMEAMEKSYLGRYKNSKELDQYSKETTPLNQILGGYLRSEVKCLSCQHVSTTFQHFEDLLLDIRKANSIDEALEVYFARERLEEMGYKCEACKRRVAATKQFSLERAPFALCVQLKRFSMLGGKINKHVELRSRLDLTPYSSPALKGANGKLIYRLTSMVTHLGSTQHCGHYTAIGHTDAGSYHVFDDSSVRPIGMHNVTSTNAYILFYELESAAGSAGLPNGVCRTKPSSTVCQPSSTATLTSMGHLSSDTGGPGGSGGTLGKATNSSPFRMLGTGGVNGTAGGFFPSKLEQKSGFIGPVLPTSAASATRSNNSGSIVTTTSTISNSSVTTGQRAGSFVSSILSTEANGGKDSDGFSSSSPTLSTLSNTSLPSPLKQQPSQSSFSSTTPSQHPACQISQKILKLSDINGNGTSSPNGSVINEVQMLNGLSEEKKSVSLLPSMPKLLLPSVACGIKSPSSSNSSKSVHSSNTGLSVVSLVPYETDDDSDNSSVENDQAHKKPVATSANGCAKRAKQTTVCNGGKPVKMERKYEQCDKESEDRARNVEKDERNSNVGDERQETVASRSPQMIKTKTGLWKVSKSSTFDQLSFPDSGSSNDGSASSSKASSPATSGGSSPNSSPGQQRSLAQHPQQRNSASGDSVSTTLTNGYRYNNPQGHQEQVNGGGGDKRKLINGYHTGTGQSNAVAGSSLASSCSMEKAGSGGALAVQMLLKLSHRGYGAPVKSWDGQETVMDRELANERREERKRQIDDDRETEMDRGRLKKSKAGGGVGSSANGSLSNGPNMFQLYQNHHNGSGGAKWNGNGNRNGNHYSNNSQNYRNAYNNGNGQRHHGGGGGASGGFRYGGRRFGGRNGGGFHSKTYHHHQRSESSGAGGVASSGGNNGSNGFYHR